MAWLPLVLGVLDVCGGAACVLRVDSPERVLAALRDQPVGTVESITAGADRLTVRICPESSGCKDIELLRPENCPGRPAGALCAVAPEGTPEALVTVLVDRLSPIPASALWTPLPGDAPSPGPDTPPTAPDRTASPATEVPIAPGVVLWILLLPWILGAGMGARLGGRWPWIASSAWRSILLLLPPLGLLGIAWVAGLPVRPWDLGMPAAIFGLGIHWGTGRGWNRAAWWSAARGLGAAVGLLLLAEVACRLTLPDPATPPPEVATSPGVPASPTPVRPPRALGGPFPLAVLHLRFQDSTDLGPGTLQGLNRRDPDLWHVDVAVSPGTEAQAWDLARRWLEAERVLGFVFHVGPDLALSPGGSAGDSNPRPVAGPAPSSEQAPSSAAPAGPEAPVRSVLLRSAARASRLAACLDKVLSTREGDPGRPSTSPPHTPEDLVRDVTQRALAERIPVAVVRRVGTAGAAGEGNVRPGDLGPFLNRLGVPVLEAPATAGPDEAAAWLLEALGPLRSRSRAIADERIRAFRSPR